MQISLNNKMSITVSLLVTVLMAGLAFWVITNFDKQSKETIATQQHVLISERVQDIDEAIQRIQKAIFARAKFCLPRLLQKDHCDRQAVHLRPRYGVGRTMPQYFDHQVLQAFVKTAPAFEEVYEKPAEIKLLVERGET